MMEALVIIIVLGAAAYFILSGSVSAVDVPPGYHPPPHQQQAHVAPQPKIPPGNAELRADAVNIVAVPYRSKYSPMSY